MSVQHPCWLGTCGMHGSELGHVVHAPVAICSKHLLNESQIRSKRGEHSSRQGPRLADLIKVALACSARRQDSWTTRCPCRSKLELIFGSFIGSSTH